MTVSVSQRAELLKQVSDQMMVGLITISHAQFSTPLRLASAAAVRLQSDPVIYGVTSRSQSFFFSPFEVNEPSEGKGGPRRASLVLPNFDPDGVFEVALEMRNLTSRADLLFEVVMSPDYDTPILTAADWKVADSRLTDDEITLDLRADDLTFEPAPTGVYSGRQFPGLYSA